jgi:hypothetical protein
MSARITNWGVELAFIRTKVGAEFKVAKSLGRAHGQCRCYFFGTYGYFDLVAVGCIQKVNTPYLVLLDDAICESAPFRFFADEQNQTRQKFEQDLSRWPAAIFTFCKIYAPSPTHADGKARWNAAARVRKALPEAHVLFGMGFQTEETHIARGRLPN